MDGLHATRIIKRSADFFYQTQPVARSYTGNPCTLNVWKCVKNSYSSNSSAPFLVILWTRICESPTLSFP